MVDIDARRRPSRPECSGSRCGGFQRFHRLGWLKSPCMARPTGPPGAAFHDEAMSRLRLQNTIDDLGCSAWTTARRVDCLSRSLAATRKVSTVDAVVAARHFDFFGLLRNLSASLRIGGAMVAENISVCRRRRPSTSFNIRDEAHIQHSVGFVDHQNADIIGMTEPRSIRSSRRPRVAIFSSTHGSERLPVLHHSTDQQAIESWWLTPYISKFSDIWAGR